MARPRKPLTAGRVTATALALTCFAFAGRAAAEAAPNRQRSDGYYVSNLSALFVLASAGYFLDRQPAPETCRCDFDWFPGDESLRGKHSRGADAVSNAFLYTTLTAPLLASLGSFGFHLRAANQGVVYGEAVSANFALNRITKQLFSRARPYTYSTRLRQFREGESDYDASFYSGHASTAFAGAMAASYLYGEGAPGSPWARRSVWTTEFALAAATAVLRTRAGKHYYSDVLVGAVVGTAIGVLIPVAHGGQYLPKTGDYIAGVSGIAIGIATGALWPFQDDGGRVLSGWSIAPLFASTGSVGIQTSGVW